LIEHLYKFEVFGGNKLIRKFPDKGWNVKGLSKLLKKLLSRTRHNGEDKPPTFQFRCQSNCSVCITQCSLVKSMVV